MRPFLTEHFGNPSSHHWAGAPAKAAVERAGAERLPNTSSVNFLGRVGAEVLSALPGVAASTGSACHAGSVELSTVLAAVGVPAPAGTVRGSARGRVVWSLDSACYQI